MRYITIIIMSVFCYNFNYSQIYEVGVFIGGSNFIGDVGATNYISPNQPAVGVILKWNRSPRHSYRVSVIYAKLEGIDVKSDDPRRKQRGYSFETNLLEISAGMEFTFFDFDLHTEGKKMTPYLYTGITAANHDNFYFNNGTQTNENTNSWAYGIPMVLGLKTRLTKSFILAIEIGARYTFSDGIDGSIPDNPSLQPNFSLGNINNNDWYTFSGITLTYTFGQNPCYCGYE
ncbi:hypothetical protein EB822_05500 [Flavobacteriaceae bacterium PRS1]|nr:hypothetical protein EB822_05500 [Flavobacteriaceae bacterium PRS1]